MLFQRREVPGRVPSIRLPEEPGLQQEHRKVIELVHGEGGVVIAAHPFKPLETGSGSYGCGDAVWALDIDGLEIEHPSYPDSSRELAQRVMEARGLCGISCSDAHDPGGIGRFRTVLEVPVTDASSLCEVIRKRLIRTKD